ncbi:MAG: hypothetical protein NE330_13095, partial [Lentisphaeraceae bacterium]|nr:hypothetical protein [Lentisphaeraceae bacterium]
LLMTARIHMLSPDIRRPGRAGDLIVPVLDPEGEDRRGFVEWVVKASLETKDEVFDKAVDLLDKEILSSDYSAASFASLRSHLKAHPLKDGEEDPLGAIRELVIDLIPADIGDTRRYQTLQAMLNCTRKSLLPKKVRDKISDDPKSLVDLRHNWLKEIHNLEEQGIN